MTETNPTQPTGPAKSRKPWIAWILAGALAGAVTYAISALLVSIFWHKVEATNPFVRLVEVTEDTIDPAIWAKNWPRQHDTYRRTVDSVRTRFGGSEAMPAQKLEKDPWLKRMFAGYAFSIDFREARGHAYMLFDQEHTERVLKRPQTGACLHSHASVLPLYRKLGDGDVQKGFEAAGKLPYAEANKLLYEASGGTAHPVACIDCHDPKTMAVRVTRPGSSTASAPWPNRTNRCPTC